MLTGWAEDGHATIVYLYLSYVGANKHRAKHFERCWSGIVKFSLMPRPFFALGTRLL